VAVADAGSPVARVGIAGLGLIGGSVAWGLRAAWPATRIIGVDAEAVTTDALRRGAIDAAAGSVADLSDADLVVLAAPVAGIMACLADAGRARLRGVVTDVGSTKRAILQAAREAGVAAFVGGHPMAGAAQGGFAHARPGLFAGRPWLIVPSAGTARGDIARVEQLVRALGAVPRRMTAGVHDRTMAYVSGLPQVVAVALMRAAGNAVGAEGLAVAGPALADMTRIASSPPALWEGILATNPDFVAEALSALIRDLEAAQAGAASGTWIAPAFNDARAWRAWLDSPAAWARRRD
jgi:prephenate dehydrogenase